MIKFEGKRNVPRKAILEGIHVLWGIEPSPYRRGLLMVAVTAP
jgi:hypothetical protein